MPITAGQELHRAYLQSEGWKRIRAQALAHYGHVCSRCGLDGHDVHHRTYVRVGGMEQMRDLEVLCRVCHQAHHAAERMAHGSRKSVRRLNAQAAYRILTARQKTKLCARHGIRGPELYLKMVSPPRHAVVSDAETMLGCEILSGTVETVFPPIASKAKKDEEVRMEKRNERTAFLISVGIRRQWCESLSDSALKSSARQVGLGVSPLVVAGRRGLVASEVRP